MPMAPAKDDEGPWLTTPPRRRKRQLVNRGTGPQKEAEKRSAEAPPPPPPPYPLHAEAPPPPLPPSPSHASSDDDRSAEVEDMMVQRLRKMLSVDAEYKRQNAEFGPIHLDEAVAMKLYEGQYKKPFTLVHQPKWFTYVAQLEEDKNKSATVDITDDTCEEHPIGREAAMAQHNRKRKLEEVLNGIVLLGENITKIVEVQKDRKEEHQKVTDAT